MKKNVSLIVGCIVALIVGYVAGAYVGLPGVDKKATSGDVNTFNEAQQMLVQPDYMSFNSQFKDNAEIQERTIESLLIIEQRLQDFSNLSEFIEKTAEGNESVAESVAALKKAAENSTSVIGDAQNAVKAAKDLKEGKEVDMAKSLQAATNAYNAVTEQLKAGKEFVDAVDALIAKDPKFDVVLATGRDLMAGHCAVNAVLCQDDQAIDYWYNTSELLQKNDMAETTVGNK